MSNIKAVIWSMKCGFMHTPVLFISYTLMQLLRSSLVVYTTVLLGNIISDIQMLLTEHGDLSKVAEKLILYGILNIVVWLFVELQWRFKDDFLPLRASVGASKFLIRFSKHIPLRKYDDSAFCDQYDRFQQGIHSQYRFLMQCITVGITVYSFVLSSIELAKLHFLFVFILAVFFIVEMLPARKHANIRNNIRKEITPYNRHANYLHSMFFGIYNRDTRIYGLKDSYIEKWAQNKRNAAKLEIEGNKKVNRTQGFLYYLQTGICPLLIIGIALFLVRDQILTLGSIYTIWELSRVTLSRSADTATLFIDCIAQAKHAKETYSFFCEFKKNSSKKGSDNLSANMFAPAFLVRHADFSYLPENKVLHSIDMEVHKGEIIALLGENGSGKSTLIKLLLGIYAPDCGTVQVFGNDASIDDKYIRDHIGVTFQDFCQYPFTLRENVAFGNILEIENDTRTIESLRIAEADGVLDKAENIDRMLGRSLDNTGIELSGGEWQRVALARAYFGARDIMIFDEPAAKLDPLAEERQFAHIIKHARECGKTVILVSHRVGFARMADRIVFLKSGRITETGTHTQLMQIDGDYKRMFDAQREMYAAMEGGKV